MEMMLRGLAMAGLNFAVLGFAMLGVQAARAGEPVTSPSIVAQTHAPMPANVAALDTALKSNDYATINHVHAAIKSGDEMVLFMNWEQVRAFEGGGFYVSYIYMSDLWGMASSLPAGTTEQADEIVQLKRSAVLVGLLSYELVVLDGAKCSDPTAVGHRMDQLMANPAWSYVDQIPEDLRHKMIDGVVRLETFSAAKRANDNVLCTGGMTQMIASLAAQGAAGKQPQEVPNAPGMVGKTYAVPPAPVLNIYLDQSVWQPKQDKLRAAMPGQLASLMKLSKPLAK
jgi:hypothetical protein